MDMLKEIFKMQDELNSKVGCSVADVQKMSLEKRLTWLRKYSQAQLIELSESLVEYGAKWWKADSFEYNEPASVEEAADELHFLISKFLLMGCSAEDVYSAYVKKHAKNMVRPDWDGHKPVGIEE